MARVQKLRTRRHTVVLNRSKGGDAGISFFLIIMGAFMFLPMLYTILQSLKPLDELWAYPPKFYVVSPTLKNFKDLFRLMNTSWVPFSRYIFNTVVISVTGTFGNLALSALAAYVLSKLHFPGKNWMFKLIVLSLMFNAVVAGIANFIIMSSFGWVDTYLAVIIPSWGSTLGLYLMKQYMDSSVSDAVLESARLDGAKELRIFWSIALPMVKPACLTLIVESFKNLWNSGSTIYIYSEELKTFNYAIGQIIAGGVVRSGAAAASTVVMMIVPITVFVVSQSNIIETMASSGMKD